MSKTVESKIDKDGVKYFKTKDGYFSPANERILALKRLYPDYEIHTDMIYMSEINSWLAKTIVRIETETVARDYTGHACRAISADKWGSVACEVAETSSVARAIAKLGIGIEYSNASLDEVMQSDFSFELFDTEEVESKSDAVTKELQTILKRKK